MRSWRAEIDPGTLGIRGVRNGRALTLASPSSQFGPANGLRLRRGGATWVYAASGLRVSVTAKGDQLLVRIDSSKEQAIIWPVSGRDPAVRALIVPDNEGLYLPVTDARWRAIAKKSPCRRTHEQLSMPFWGLQLAEATATYIVPDELHNLLCTKEHAGRLEIRLRHRFEKREGLPPLRLLIGFSAASPIGPALAYRAYLKRNKRFVTLREKIRKLPIVERLLGATHIYLWGDGRTLAALETLHRLGLRRLWLGYDQEPKWDRYLVTPAFAIRAKHYGYLVGAYEIFTKLDPRTMPDGPQSVTSTFDDALFPAACITNRDGTRRRGWNRFGCELSSEALRRLEKTGQPLMRRVRGHVTRGVRSIFVDEDAYGDFFADYDPRHPMTVARDRDNRLRRLAQIRKLGLVLGSETVTARFVPALHFNHGTLTIQNPLYFKWNRNKAIFGGHTKTRATNIFFKSIATPNEIKEANFNPIYRLPLFQAVFHDAIVSTDRYELSPVKLNDLVQIRELLRMLYNLPQVWSLDRAELAMHARRLKENDRVFAPLHRRIGDQQLTRFEWLSADRLVQRTRFGQLVELTANFGARPHHGLAPLCLEIHWLGTKKRQRYCPSACRRGEDCYAGPTRRRH
ncbi:MAG: hypothetical protein KC609_25720 [Myxococcales bacterium]|nr:hypothetical protein [Myxococcales bacterium]